MELVRDIGYIQLIAESRHASTSWYFRQRAKDMSKFSFIIQKYYMIILLKI